MIALLFQRIRFELEDLRFWWWGWRWKIPAFFRGELSLCRRCRIWNMCHVYGEGVDLHRASMERHGAVTHLEPVPDPYRTLRVCGGCCNELDKELGIHEGCPCVPLMQKKLRSFLGGLVNHPVA